MEKGRFTAGGFMGAEPGCRGAPLKAETPPTQKLEGFLGMLHQTTALRRMKSTKCLLPAPGSGASAMTAAVVAAMPAVPDGNGTRKIFGRG